jgi:uncharacterized RDD family membrane protein YckC
MKTPRTLLLLLVFIFILFEILFLYYVYLEGNVEELPGSAIKTLFFLLFIFLYSKKMTWARWTLSILLVLYSIMCLMVAIEAGYLVFYLMALYHTFFAIFIHTSPVLRQHFNAAPKEEHAATDAQRDLPPGSFLINNEVYRYPRLVKRYKALLIDGLLLLVVMIVVIMSVEGHAYERTIKIVTWFVAGFLYEPLLTTYSQTVGQRLMGIAVRRVDDPTKRINLGHAYMRIVLKALLGWLSFITINFNAAHRAIHDFASDSVVIEE